MNFVWKYVFLIISSKTDKKKIPEPRGYRDGKVSRIYDAFRSYLNVFDDEVGEYFLLNSVMCIFIFENSIVDRAYNLFGVKLVNFNEVYSQAF